MVSVVGIPRRLSSAASATALGMPLRSQSTPTEIKRQPLMVRWAALCSAAAVEGGSFKLAPKGATLTLLDSTP
jgi:hypothetical protein